MKKLLFAVFLSASTLSSFATAVRILPEPDADGYYVFGAPYTYSKTTSYEWKADANTPAYPIWSEINVPAGAKIKLTGGVIIDSWPTGVTEVDCSGLTFMAIVKNKAIPASVKLTVPSSAKCAVCYFDLTVDENDAVSAKENTRKDIELACGLEVNGSLYWQFYTLNLSGDLTGNGAINLHKGNPCCLQLPPDVSFDGYVVMDGNTSPIQELSCSGTSAKLGLFSGYKSGDTCSSIVLSDGVSARFECVCGNGCQWKIKEGSCDASVEIANLTTYAKTSGTLLGDYYLSKNVTYEISQIGFKAGTATMSKASTVNLHYEQETGNNTNAFSITGVDGRNGICYASGSGSQTATVNISGTSPASLPRLMKLWRYDSQTTSGVKYTIGADVTLSSSEWAFDFDWTKDDPNLSRCEITGAKNATIPESGTIAITTNGKPGAKTVYPLFTCNVGCAALADAAAWPVTINGTLVEGDEFSDGTAKYKIIRTETGIYLQANIVKGLMLILR